MTLLHGTSFGGVKKAARVSGAVGTIFGCGELGLYAMQLAARSGDVVVAVNVDAGKPGSAKRVGTNRVVAADRAATKILSMVGPVDACIEFTPTTATWATMTAVIRPPGRIISAALVSEPVPLNQQCLTATGVTLTGTSVGTLKKNCSSCMN